MGGGRSSSLPLPRRILHPLLPTKVSALVSTSEHSLFVTLMPLMPHFGFSSTVVRSSAACATTTVSHCCHNQFDLHLRCFLSSETGVAPLFELLSNKELWTSNLLTAELNISNLWDLELSFVRIGSHQFFHLHVLLFSRGEEKVCCCLPLSGQMFPEGLLLFRVVKSLQLPLKDYAFQPLQGSVVPAGHMFPEDLLLFRVVKSLQPLQGSVVPAGQMFPEGLSLFRAVKSLEVLLLFVTIDGNPIPAVCCYLQLQALHLFLKFSSSIFDGNLSRPLLSKLKFHGAIRPRPLLSKLKFHCVSSLSSVAVQAGEELNIESLIAMEDQLLLSRNNFLSFTLRTRQMWESTMWESKQLLQSRNNFLPIARTFKMLQARET
ncbi:hypothetical protein V8G54_016478 [Vigna mungo]|uniref:Uncharacterized protein n=1 Tax=Vigna mungo TaxID=3915 RepID=A0AAQ3NP29_VIGMU